MPEKKVKIPFPTAPGGMIDGFEVPIIESNERWTEIKLEDGSIIRVKPNVVSAARAEGMFDADGNPQYALKTSQIMMVASAPEHLRKGGKGTKAVQ